MRILFVHDRFGSLGGAEANLLQVAAGFRERGDTVALLSGERELSNSGAPEGLFESVFCWHESGQSLTAAFVWEPDVIYVHHLSNLAILEAVVTSGIPAVRMVHDHHVFCQRGSRYFPWNRKACTRKAGYDCALTCSVVRKRGADDRLPYRLAWPGTKLREMRLCQQFPRLVVQTEYMKSELTLHGFAEDRIRILPVIPADNEPAPVSFERSDDDSPPLILFVGQVIRGKGVDFMLRALKRIEGSDWTCSVAGDGNHLAYCRRLCRKLGLDERVTFHGRLERDELAGLYRRARLGVVPSVWPEPMGMVGLEFMAEALPVVAFDVGGISDWLADGETGFLAPPRDTGTLAERIDRLLEDRSLARQLGRRGQERSRERYRFDDYLENLHRILEEVSDRIPETKAPTPAPVSA